MTYYIGMDVSQRFTSLCIVDQEGAIISEGKTLTLPSDIFGWLKNEVDLAQIQKAALETGSMSNWLFAELTALGLPMICLEAYQAHLFLKTQRNKTDKNDARGLAQMVRIGGKFIKPVLIRSLASQEIRALLVLRQDLVHQRITLENTLAGVLKPFGLLTPRRAGFAVFRKRLAETLGKAEERGLTIQSAIAPLLDLYDCLCAQTLLLTTRAEALANTNPVCRRLMTVPGVGPIVALSFVTAIDDPYRFTKSVDIGAYFGLTPIQHQSGQMDIKTTTSKRGDVMTRTHLVQAATVLLTNTKKWCTLKAWGIKIAQKRGLSKARVAVARKLAIILHRMWINEQDFRWTDQAGVVSAD